MTIASQTSRINYVGNGSTTAFAIPFYWQANSDIVVMLQNSAGTQTAQVLGTDYSLTGVGVSSGGTCTFTVAPTAATGAVVMIYRDPPVTQTTSYNNNDPFPAKSHETALDKGTTIDQRTRDMANRALRLSDSDATTSLTIPTLPVRRGKLLGFDASTGAAVASTNTMAAMDLVISGALATSGGFNRIVLTATYASLRLVTPFAGAVIYMQGYYSDGDGGGGIFIWTPASVAAHNAGTIIQPLAGGVGRWIRVVENVGCYNVMWFGAKGDGVTNDTAAIQATVDAVGALSNGVYGSVEFPAKVFNLVTGITITFPLALRGAAGHQQGTMLLYSPTTSGTLITVGDGVLLRSYGGIYDMAIYSADTTRKKTAISIISMDIYTVDSVTINGSAGWTGASSIGIKIQGRDMQNYNRIVIVADQCIYIGADPLSAATGLDQSTFTNLLMTGTSATLPLIDVQTGVGLGNITFDGYQAWTIGAGGFRWIDTTSVGVSQGISFNNIRSEQSLDPTQYLFDIQHNTGIQCLSFNNVAIGDRLGWRLRKCQNTTITGSMHTFAGRTFDVTSSDTSLEWINCALGTVAASSLTGVYQQYAFPSNVGGALPMSAKYLVSTNVFQNKSEAPWGSDTITVANNANALITNTTSTSTVMVIVSTSIGTTAIYALNGTNHTVAEVSDPSGQFTIAVGTAASTNIYWSAGNARYEIENKTGSSINYTFTMLGRAS